MSKAYIRARACVIQRVLGRRDTETDRQTQWQADTQTCRRTDRTDRRTDSYILDILDPFNYTSVRVYSCLFVSVRVCSCLFVHTCSTRQQRGVSRQP